MGTTIQVQGGEDAPKKPAWVQQNRYMVEKMPPRSQLGYNKTGTWSRRCPQGVSLGTSKQKQDREDVPKKPSRIRINAVKEKKNRLSSFVFYVRINENFIKLSLLYKW
ncbi:hypothetical protein [Bacillus sp. P14.5]|uniref:hypothetical protein n=1 Tax=Bacillus sp. P14.5 TaxID=1983400 RepID=UPI0013B06BA0|nr:hypothetical protein [Bacillus sp. P14.5]